MTEGITEKNVYRSVQMFVRKTDIQVSGYVFIYDDEQGSCGLVLEPSGFGYNFSKAAGMSQPLRNETESECFRIMETQRMVRIFLMS